MKLKGFVCMLAATLLLSSCGVKTTIDVVTGNTNSNITNLGSACQAGDVIYYQKDVTEGNIYKMNVDGSEEVPLNEEYSYFINVVDDTVYYVNADDNFNLYSMDINGENKAKLYDGPVYYVSVVNDSIYFCLNTLTEENQDGENYNLYKMDRKTQQTTKLSSDTCHYVNVLGNYIYYSNWSDGNRLYRIKTDGSEKQKLTNDGAMYVNATEEGIYFSKWVYGADSVSDRKIYRVDLDGNNEVCLNNTESGDLNVYNGRVYYSNWEAENICSVSVDGGDVQIENEEYGTYLNIAGDTLYYISYDENKNIQRGSLKLN